VPARIIGMIGVTPPQSTSALLVIEGAISPAKAAVAEVERIVDIRALVGRRRCHVTENAFHRPQTYR
jgi:hypothetical protein